MTLYYGPATWFLTLSPSEWTWNDMGEYLHKVDPHLKHLSISKLAFVEFIMSDDNPICKVAHYYCQQEYQGRGLQHFHFAIWVQDALVLSRNSKDENNCNTGIVIVKMMKLIILVKMTLILKMKMKKIKKSVIKFINK